MAEFVSMNMTGSLDGALDKLEAHIKNSVALSGVAAAAKNEYEEVKLNCPESLESHYFYGTSYKLNGTKYGPYSPGNLRRSIYRVYAKDRSNDLFQVYRISWNHDKAPYGVMLEYGRSYAGAYSFMRKSVSNLPRAIEAGRKRIAERMAEGMPK